MSQYPVFNGSPFAANTNQLPFNINQNINIPSNVSPFQQNPNMSFLSYPPPSLTGSHHVFQNGPRFPGAINAMPPAVFASNTLSNPNMMASSSFATNTIVNPNMVASSPFATNTIVNPNMMASSPFATNTLINPNMTAPSSFATNTLVNPSMMAPSTFATNIPNGNLISPSPFTSNVTIPALTSVPPPQASPMWNPTPLDKTPSSTPFNGSSNFRETRNLSGHFQQTPPKLNAQNINPWSNAPSNNFQSSTSNTINPWVVDPSKVNNGFNTFQSQGIKSDPPLQNSVNPWASNSNSSNLSHNFQGNQVHIEESSSKFGQSKSPASDINPWVQSPTNSTGSAIDSYQFSNNRERHYQRNFNTNSFSKPNFNSQRSNSRFSSSNNYRRQDRNFKGERNFKRESNESKPFSCDTCDRSFSSEGEFQDHMSEHIKCNFKDCHFEAHPKIVALHKRMQHDTGYADTINKLKNADEIEKWRAERRRRFPTAANILKRKAEQAEREARGEVIENKDFGKFKKQNTGQREQKNKSIANRKRGKNYNRNRMDNPSVTVSDSGSDSDDSHIKLRKFSGILAVADVLNPVTEESSIMHNSLEKLVKPIENAMFESSKNENLNVHLQKEPEENEDSIINSNNMESMDESMKGSANSNPINIESDDDDAKIKYTIVKTVNDDKESDDESPIEIPVSKVPLNEISNSNSGIEENLPSIAANKDDAESDDDSPVEIPVSKVPLNDTLNSTSIIAKNKPHTDDKIAGAEVKKEKFSSKAEQHKKNSNKKNDSKFVHPVKKSSLLEKLLADDIRHERNVIMQCIRHIVKKDYFGIGSDA